MAATCSEDAVAMLSSDFNRYLKEATDSLDAYSTAIKEFYEGNMYILSDMAGINCGYLI